MTSAAQVRCCDGPYQGDAKEVFWSSSPILCRNNVKKPLIARASVNHPKVLKNIYNNMLQTVTICKIVKIYNQRYSTGRRDVKYACKLAIAAGSGHGK